MAKKKRSFRRKGMNLRGYVKKAANVTAAGLIAGPVLIPAVSAVRAAGYWPGVGAGGGVAGNNVAYEFVYESIGFNIPTNTMDSNKMGQIITRDIALVGGGLVLRWLAKKV